MNEMVNHTPAPWTVKGSVVTKSNGLKVRLDRPKGAAPEAWESIIKQNEADARLIASAPDLFEACDLLLLFIEPYGKPVDGYRFREAAMAIREAVTKIKGGEEGG